MTTVLLVVGLHGVSESHLSSGGTETATLGSLPLLDEIWASYSLQRDLGPSPFSH